MAVAYVLGETVQASAELVALARSVDAAEVVLVTAGEPDAEQLAAGADRALVLSGSSPRLEAYAAPLAELLVEQDALLLVPSSASGREVAAYAAGLAGCAMASDASSLFLDGLTVRIEHSIYGGAVVETCEMGLPCVATVLSGSCAPVASAPTTEVETRTVKADERVSRLELVSAVNEGVDLADASSVVCVGMGIDGEEDVAMAEELAGLLGGAVGCTRDVAEGLKLLPKERYIGITGVSVRSDLYLALGVSGQLQHVYGVRDAKVVAAVNTNKDAPIFRSADYGIVGDLHEVVPQLIEQLRA